MKKQLLAIAAAFLMTIPTAFATEKNPVPDAVATAFQKAFKHIGDVQWKTTSHFYKASFTANGQVLDAFYDLEGKMIGLSRALTPAQLPMSLVKEVLEKSAANHVTELFELLTDKGTEYFITYNNGKESTTYKSAGSAWVRY
jgi:23S rRNA maturation mini-RNase III